MKFKVGDTVIGVIKEYSGTFNKIGKVTEIFNGGYVVKFENDRSVDTIPVFETEIELAIPKINEQKFRSMLK